MEEEEYDYIFKIILIGDSRVGKSCIASCLVGKEFNKYEETTIGVDFKTCTRELPLYKKLVKYYIWDTAGQEKFNAITKNYYRNIAGGIIIYDVTDRRSFNRVNYWLEQIKENSSQELNIHKMPILLFGNKIDQYQNRKVYTEEGQALADEHNIEFLEGSVLNNININNIFDLLGEQIYVDFVKKNIEHGGIKDIKKEKAKKTSAKNYL